MSTWLAPLRGPMEKVKPLMEKARKKRGLPSHRLTTRPTDRKQGTDHILGSGTQPCGQNEILDAVLQRDRLAIGLEAFGHQGKAIAQLISELLKWNPGERMSASEAAASPLFGDIVPA